MKYGTSQEVRSHAERAQKSWKQTEKKTVHVSPSVLSETEQDLLRRLEDGYQLKTDSLGGDPLLRQAKDQEALPTI